MSKSETEIDQLFNQADILHKKIKALLYIENRKSYDHYRIMELYKEKEKLFHNIGKFYEKNPKYCEINADYLNKRLTIIKNNDKLLLDKIDEINVNLRSRLKDLAKSKSLLIYKKDKK